MMLFVGQRHAFWLVFSVLAIVSKNCVFVMQSNIIRDRFCTMATSLAAVLVGFHWISGGLAQWMGLDECALDVAGAVGVAPR